MSEPTAQEIVTAIQGTLVVVNAMLPAIVAHALSVEEERVKATYRVEAVGEILAFMIEVFLDGKDLTAYQAAQVEQVLRAIGLISENGQLRPTPAHLS